VRTDEFLAKKKNNIYRQLLVFILKKSTGCTLKTIGDFMGMDYVAVSMASKRFEARMIRDPHAFEYFQRAESEIEKLRREI
jgi:chromosomal replication initiation ATPase DnaA